MGKVGVGYERVQLSGSRASESSSVGCSVSGQLIIHLACLGNLVGLKKQKDLARLSPYQVMRQLQQEVVRLRDTKSLECFLDGLEAFDLLRARFGIPRFDVSDGHRFKGFEGSAKFA